MSEEKIPVIGVNGQTGGEFIHALHKIYSVPVLLL